MNRKKTIIGNWKMHKTLSQAVRDFTQLTELLANSNSNADVGIAAPSLFLAELSRLGKGIVNVYAQNSHWAQEGAFTGEISPLMLKDLRVAGALVAHSERRQMFGETDTTAGKRMGNLIKNGCQAVFCVGETLEQREKGQLKDVLARQIQTALKASGLGHSSEFIGLDETQPLLCVAYEPVWAIGTGKSASAKEAQAAHEFIREELGRYFNEKTAQKIKILYGGSVKPDNICEFLSCADVDGALVGGASLKSEEFAKLCTAFK